MRFVRRIKILSIAAAALFALVGLGLIIYPRVSAVAACRILGVASIVFGAVRICGYFSRDLYRLAYQFDLATGILLMLAGAIVILRARNIVEALPMLAGLFIIVEGLFKLQTALDARRFGVANWGYILILAALSVILGTLLMIRPFESVDVMMRLLGAALIISSLQNIYTIHSTVRVVKDARRLAEEEYPPWDDG